MNELQSCTGCGHRRGDSGDRYCIKCGDAFDGGTRATRAPLPRAPWKPSEKMLLAALLIAPISVVGYAQLGLFDAAELALGEGAAFGLAVGCYFGLALSWFLLFLVISALVRFVNARD